MALVRSGTFDENGYSKNLKNVWNLEGKDCNSLCLIYSFDIDLRMVVVLIL